MATVRNTIRFFLNGELRSVASCDPTTTLLDWLREEQKLTGTKEGCAEGDCGACTVAVASLNGDEVNISSFNACILFMPVLDGKSVITVEGIAESAHAPHPVQRAMVDEHGSQCGFCTPGIVMSLFAMTMSASEDSTNRRNINLNLAGNLCRCTGYVPIVKAAQQALASTSQYSAKARSRIRGELESLMDERMLALAGKNGEFFAPRTLAQLCDLRAEHPQATLLAGATDVGLWVTKHLVELPSLIYTRHVSELLEHGLSEDGTQYVIGAAVTYSDVMEELVRHFPGMKDMLERLGAQQVRNAGTVGGNIANGSPIGDMPPALIALGARIELQSSTNRRTIDLEDFFIEYGRQDLGASEVLARIFIPIETDQQFACYKVSKRAEQDISAVCGAINLQQKQGMVTSARICFGGMAGVPARAHACERALVGSPFSLETTRAAMNAMDQDYEPISDMRASADYRQKVASNMLLRFFHEQQDGAGQARLSVVARGPS